MTLDEIIVNNLINHPGLSAIISNRVYPLVLPQNPTLPAVVYQQISAARSYSQSGYSALTRPRYQFSLYDNSYSGCKAAANQLIKALHKISNCQLDNDAVGYESETALFRATIDALIFHGEAIDG